MGEGAIKTPEKITDVFYGRSHIQVLIFKNFYSSQDIKGQLISKFLFGVFNSPKKKTNEKIWLYYYG